MIIPLCSYLYLLLFNVIIDEWIHENIESPFSKGEATYVNRKLLAWSQNGTTPKGKKFSVMEYRKHLLFPFRVEVSQIYFRNCGLIWKCTHSH